MAQQILPNLESAVGARGIINGNFTELYGALPLPIKAPGLAANSQIQIPAGSFLWYMFITPVSGDVTISIGTTPGGTELMDATELLQFISLKPELPCPNVTNIYITITAGAGEFNVSAILIQNAF